MNPSLLPSPGAGDQLRDSKRVIGESALQG